MSEQVEVVYSPPNENELKMLQGTISPDQLKELEEKEELDLINISEEEKIKNQRKEYITKVKCLAMDLCGKTITSNPSYMSYIERQKIIKAMETLIHDESESSIDEMFNVLCCEKVFKTGTNYETLFNK